MATKKAKKLATVRPKIPKKLKKVASFCGKNPGTCAAGAAGLAIGGFYGVKQWEKLSKEKKECLNVCYPEDWQAYKSGEIDRPTYKDKSGVSPYDEEVHYAALYPALKDQLCTKANMLQKGVKNGDCKSFCEDVCDFNVTDVIGGAVGAMKDDVQGAGLGLLGGGLETLFGPNVKYYLMGLLAVVVLLFLLPVLLPLLRGTVAGRGK